ncbi:nucleolar complex protein 4 homolog isoform X3 [Heterodontus francisci]|uniref:nucleolar complex protein 4 homolog isoform X3 n=1 Tax=Heterodontus francisci TaxID=7792 RepID=UPI00355B0E23
MAAPSGKDMRSAGDPQPEPEAAAQAQLLERLQLVLGNRKNANVVFDMLEGLEAEQEAEILAATRTCGRLFCTLLQRGDLFVGQLPGEEEGLSADYSAEVKYKIWMRHRYQSCIDQLLNLMMHESDQVQEVALCTLMKFVRTEGRWPLVKYEVDEHYIFPGELLKLLVKHLLQVERDTSSLLTQFQECLEYEDVRYYVMAFAAENIPSVMQSFKGGFLPIYQQNVFGLLSSIHMPGDESELKNFLVKQQSKHDAWKAAKLKEHRRMFERLWLAFLKHKLSTNLYKKVLVILHESILPHMSKPTLMIDFLTAAYEIGGAISLLALNGLFYLIHHHNLLLQKAVQFAGSNCATCKVPGEISPPAGSLLVVQALQKHYHPDVANAAATINKALSSQEADLSSLLNLSVSELFEKEPKKREKSVPMEFEPAEGLLSRKNDLVTLHWSLE